MLEEVLSPICCHTIFIFDHHHLISYFYKLHAHWGTRLRLCVFQKFPIKTYKLGFAWCRFTCTSNEFLCKLEHVWHGIPWFVWKCANDYIDNVLGWFGVANVQECRLIFLLCFTTLEHLVGCPHVHPKGVLVDGCACLLGLYSLHLEAFWTSWRSKKRPNMIGKMKVWLRPNYCECFLLQASVNV